MEQQSTFKKWAAVISLGYMGGLMYTLMYIRYVFYDQMMEVMNITNMQLGMLTTVSGTVAILVNIPGGYFSDKWDAKHCIVNSIAAMTGITFVFAAFINSYHIALLLWGLMPALIFSYWPSLIKYINNLGGEGEAGSSFGTYYLFNGIAGALGNAIPLLVMTRTGNFRLAIIALGFMTLLAVVLVQIFLDDEKTLASRGVHLKGDEPIRVKYIGSVLKWPGFWLLALTIFVDYSIYSNLSYFNPYLINVLGIEPSASSAVSIIRSYGAMVVAPLGGIMADKVFKGTCKWFMGNMVVTALVIAFVFTFGPDSNKLFVTIYSLVPSIVVYSMYSVQYSIIRELHFSPVVVGTAIGVSGLAGNLGNVIWPTFFGNILDTYGNDGYRMIFMCLIGFCAAVFMVGFAVYRWDKRCKAGKSVFKLRSE